MAKAVGVKTPCAPYMIEMLPQTSVTVWAVERFIGNMYSALIQGGSESEMVESLATEPVVDDSGSRHSGTSLTCG